MKTKIILSVLIIFLLTEQSNCQKIKIEDPFERTIYDIENFPVNFSIEKSEIANAQEIPDTINCQIKFINLYKEYSQKEIFNNKISLEKGKSSKILINISDKILEISDTINACKILIFLSYNVKEPKFRLVGDRIVVDTNLIKISITDSSKIFCMMNYSKFKKSSFPFNFDEKRYYCLFLCEKKIINLYEKQRIVEIANRRLENDQMYDDSVKKLTEDIKKRNDENQKREVKAIQNSYWKRNQQYFNPIPVHDETDAKLFYTDEYNKKTLEFLQNSNINFNFDGNASLYSDIISTYMGPVNLSIGNLISNNANVDTTSQSDSTTQSAPNKEDAIQKLVGGGGNLLLKASYPLFIFKLDDRREINPIFKGKSLVFAKVAYNIPGIGTVSSDNLNFSLQCGANIDFTAGKPDFSFMSNIKYTFIWGTADFRKTLGIGEGTKYSSNIISMFKADFGFNISNKFLVGVNFYFGSKYVNDNFKTTAFFTVIP